MDPNSIEAFDPTTIEGLLQVMRMLRDPRGGCPWDLEQDFRSISAYTIEEAYEVADAIARGEHQDLKDELGDLLFQVVFHAQIAAEKGLFQFPDVVAAIVDKMIRRHPHVFRGESVGSVSEQNVAWEKHKQAERENADERLGSHLAHVTLGLPALKRAYALQKAAARVGFDWQDRAGVWLKFHEEVAEIEAALQFSGGDLHVHEEIGDLLFTCVNLARHLAVDPESALVAASAKFEQRFRRMESTAGQTGHDLRQLTDAQLDEIWERVKGEMEHRAGMPDGEKQRHSR